MAAEQASLPLPAPDAWAPPKGRQACGRDPAKGPGTCWHWWDMCPRAEARGCYELWKDRKRAELAEGARA